MSCYACHASRLIAPALPSALRRAKAHVTLRALRCSQFANPSQRRAPARAVASGASPPVAPPARSAWPPRWRLRPSRSRSSSRPRTARPSSSRVRSTSTWRSCWVRHSASARAFRARLRRGRGRMSARAESLPFCCAACSERAGAARGGAPADEDGEAGRALRDPQRHVRARLPRPGGASSARSGLPAAEPLPRRPYRLSREQSVVQVLPADGSLFAATEMPGVLGARALDGAASDRLAQALYMRAAAPGAPATERSMRVAARCGCAWGARGAVRRAAACIAPLEP